MSEKRMNIASDEDGETMFVLVDEAAPTVEAVESGWRDAATRDWGIEYEDYEDDEGPDVTRGWYKTDALNDEQVIRCPDRSEEWWSFELPFERARADARQPKGEQ